MLTKQDLNQIRKVTREAVKEGTKTLTVDVKSLKIDVTSLKISVSNLETSFKAMRKDLKKIDKKFDRLFDFIDKEHMNLVRRVIRIEDHLGIRPVADL